MWSEIIAQHRATEIFQRAIQSSRVAHAYCVWGPPGCGKEALALAFARCVNCSDVQISSSGLEACGLCKSCTQFAHLQHPNVSLVFALPTPKTSSGDGESPIARLSEEQLAELQENLSLKSANPYHPLQMSGASQIRIALVRDIKRSLQLRQAQAGRRVVIISEAHTMTAEAANAFLKTLEEPQDNVTFILCTSRRDLLPQTIVSRCQSIQCEQLQDDDIAEALVARESLDVQSARLCASLSQGNYAYALTLQQSDTRQLRNDVVELLRSVLRPHHYRLDLMTTLDSLTRQTDRVEIEKMLQLLHVWMRDAMLVSVRGAEAAIINTDQREILTKFVAAYADRDYSEIQDSIENCIRNIRANGQIHLNVLCALLSVRRTILNASA